MNITNPTSKIEKEQGISLIELFLVIIAIAVLAIMVASLPASIQSIRNSGNTSLATEISNKEMDFLRSQPYAGLSNGVNTFTDPNLLKLPSPTAQYEIDDCPIQVCANGEVAKKIKVTVSWVESGITKNVELTTLTTMGGLSQ